MMPRKLDLCAGLKILMRRTWPLNETTDHYTAVIERRQLAWERIFPHYECPGCGGWINGTCGNPCHQNPTTAYLITFNQRSVLWEIAGLGRCTLGSAWHQQARDALVSKGLVIDDRLTLIGLAVLACAHRSVQEGATIGFLNHACDLIERRLSP